MRGFWPDERVEGGIWNLKNPMYYLIYHYFKKKEKKYFEKADHIISLTEKGKEKIISEFQIIPSKIDVIPCCVDTDFFSTITVSESDKQYWKEKLNITEDNFIVSYSGSLGTWYLPDEMFGFFRQFLLLKPSARFLLITPDKPDIVIEKALKNHIHPEKIIITRALREQMPVLLSLSNIAVFFIRPVGSKVASSPTKMGELMSMGIPFVTNKGIGDVDEHVNKYKLGVVIDEFTDDAYKKAAEMLLNPTHFSPENIRKAAIEKYSLDNGSLIYKKVYQKLLKK